MTRVLFRGQIKDWLARSELTDARLDDFIRMADETLSDGLRVANMVTVSDALITDRRVRLPVGWKELDYVRPEGGKLMTFRARDEFFDFGDDSDDNSGRYTLVGNDLIIGGAIDTVLGTSIEISYYAAIPAMTDTVANWVYDHNFGLYLFAAIAAAAFYGIEDERAVGIDGKVTSMMEKLNAAHRISKTSGGPIKSVRKGFG